MTVQEAIDELAHQLEWRGPTGKKMGHVVLNRDTAAGLLLALSTMQLELLQYHQALDALRKAQDSPNADHYLDSPQPEKRTSEAAALANAAIIRGDDHD